MSLKELSLCTGMGGGIYGSMILGWETVAYVEKDEYCRQVIAQRIQDGWFDKGEIYGDIAEFNKTDASKYSGKIDIITGGFPCQPFSVAGKRKGTSDERYLFDEIIKTIKIVQPRRLLFENVPGILTSNAIIEIYKSLDKIGYRCKPPLLLGSDDCGNIHRRKRVWIYAVNTDCVRKSTRFGKIQSENGKVPKWNNNAEPNYANAQFHATNTGSEREQGVKSQTIQRESALPGRKDIRGLKDLLSRPDVPTPLFCGVADELPAWRKQLKAIGNGQDPVVMATAYKILSEVSA